MSACAHRPEDGCVWIPCAMACPDHKCVCKDEVEQDIAQDAPGSPLTASEVTSG